MTDVKFLLEPPKIGEVLWYAGEITHENGFIFVQEVSKYLEEVEKREHIALVLPLSMLEPVTIAFVCSISKYMPFPDKYYLALDDVEYLTYGYRYYHIQAIVGDPKVTMPYLLSYKELKEINSIPK